MNYPYVSPKTIVRIARGSVALTQSYYYHSNGWSNRYFIRVTYPNGYGALITFDSDWDSEACWEVALLKDGELYVDSDGEDFTWPELTEEGVIELCDRIYFFDEESQGEAGLRTR
mgnify:CR=1 FL=1